MRKDSKMSMTRPPQRGDMKLTPISLRRYETEALSNFENLINLIYVPMFITSLGNEKFLLALLRFVLVCESFSGLTTWSYTSSSCSSSCSVLCTKCGIFGLLNPTTFVFGTNSFQPPKALLQHGMENTFQTFPSGVFSGFRVRLSYYRHFVICCISTGNIHLWTILWTIL
jgi:hypothetical protein